MNIHFPCTFVGIRCVVPCDSARPALLCEIRVDAAG